MKRSRSERRWSLVVARGKGKKKKGRRRTKRKKKKYSREFSTTTRFDASRRHCEHASFFVRHGHCRLLICMRFIRKDAHERETGQGEGAGKGVGSKYVFLEWKLDSAWGIRRGGGEEEGEISIHEMNIDRLSRTGCNFSGSNVSRHLSVPPSFFFGVTRARRIVENETTRECACTDIHI